MKHQILSAQALLLISLSLNAQETKTLTKYPEIIDGSVRTIAVDEEMDRIFLSGDFTQLRKDDKPFRRFYTSFSIDGLDLDEAEHIEATPEVNGTVRDIISDGSGGKFITGEFTKVGNFDRQNIAHINADDQVTGLNLDIDGVVLDVLLDAERDVLYVAGEFNMVNGVERQNFFALDFESYEILPFNPNVNDLIYDIEQRNDTIFIGGRFNAVGSLATQVEIRRGFAAFDLSGNALELSIPFTEPSFSNRYVRDIEIIGDKVYAGGNFTGDSIGGAQYFASASLLTGEPDLPLVTLNQRVEILARDEQTDKLYFVGIFSEVNGNGPGAVGRLDLNTNTIDPWSVTIADPGGMRVETIEISDDYIFFGGNINTINGEERNNIGAINKTTNEVADFNPDTDREVYSIMVDEGKLTYGGLFQNGDVESETIDQPTFAVIDKTTGDLLPVPATPNEFIREIVLHEDKIFVSGGFTQIGDSLRAGIAALDRETLEVLDWGRNLTATIPGFEVSDIGIDENRLYYCGKIVYQGNNQRGIGALDLTDGSLVDWPEQDLLTTDANTSFVSLCISDSSVFIAGDFSVSGPNAPAPTSEFEDIVEILQTTGISTSFHPIGTEAFNDPIGTYTELKSITDVEILGNDLIVTGWLYAQDINPKNAGSGESIARINVETREFLPLTGAGLDTGNSPFEEQLSVIGRDVFVDQDFVYFASDAFAGKLAVEEEEYSETYSGEFWYYEVLNWPAADALSWIPVYRAYAITADSDGNVYLGGDFPNVVNGPRRGFAVLNTPPCDSPSPGVVSSTSITRDICLNDGIINEIQAEVEGNTGQGAFVYHDADYNIAKVKADGLFFPGSIPPGDYFISHVAYTDIESANITNLNDLRGCFSLSNPLPVNTFEADAGTISTQDATTICVGDLPLTVSVDRVNSTGLNQGFALLTSSNQIVSINAANEVLFDGLSPGNYKILSVSTQTDVALEDISPSNIPDCFDASNAIVVNITACEELLIASNPNPAVDVSNVSFTTTESENVQLELFDLTGKRIGLIYAGMAPGQTPMIFQYDTSSLPQGVYIYKLTTESEVKTTKFLKN